MRGQTLGRHKIGAKDERRECCIGEDVSWKPCTRTEKTLPKLDENSPRFPVFSGVGLAAAPDLALEM